MSLMEVLLLKLAGLVFLMLVAWFALQLIHRAIGDLARPPRPQAAVAAPFAPLPVPQPSPTDSSRTTPVAMQASAPCQELIDAPSRTYIDHCQPRRVVTPDAASVRAQQRRADEAMEVIRHSTPEM